jgi:hypothetical protein
MLPANLAKTRTAGRGTYGEFVVLSGGPSSSLGAVGPTATLRYAPYPLPATITSQQAAHAAATTHILPSPSIIQYAAGPPASIFDSLPYKRLIAANAAVTSLRPHQAQQPRATATLTYPIGDLLGVQGLDLSSLYPLQPTLTLSPQTATVIQVQRPQ